MMTKLILAAMIGASIGGVAGYFLRAAGGACPLTCNPIGGMIMGGLIGLLLSHANPFEKKDLFVPSKNVLEVATLQSWEALRKERGVILADFYADWCGPCRSLKPEIHALADQYAGRVKVVAVNVDRLSEVAQAEGVSNIPDVRIFVNGVQSMQYVGLQPHVTYVEALDKVLAESGVVK